MGCKMNNKTMEFMFAIRIFKIRVQQHISVKLYLKALSFDLEQRGMKKEKRVTNIY